MASVTLHHLTKAYDTFKAVDDLSLEIKDGEFIVLVGPSGCGKSTTLRMVAGLETVSSGEIRIGERVVNTLQPKDRNIAMVFQNYALYPHMSVFENMAFALKMERKGLRRRHTKGEIRERVEWAAQILGIVDQLEKRPKELSGGQRQRVALGRALVRKPQVFLMDEPLSNLDAKLRAHMRVELKQLHRQLKTTTIYVTHDQMEAMTLADRMAVMNKGVLQQFAPAMEAYSKPANRFVAEFIGSPMINTFEAKLVTTETGYDLEGAGFTVTLPPGVCKAIAAAVTKPKVVFGIRPEDVVVSTAGGPGKVRGTCYGVELLGNSTIAYFDVGGEKVHALVSAGFAPKIGHAYHLLLGSEKAHLFAPSGEAYF